MKLSFETERLLLRPPSLDDLEAMSGVFGDPEVMRYIGDGQALSREKVVAALERSIDSLAATGLGAFTVVDKASGRICGDCVLQKIPHSGSGWRDNGSRGPDVEIGYRLAKAWWNQGVATEAATRLLAYAFDPAGADLDRVVAVTQPSNLASQRVLVKIGMKPQGLSARYYDVECAYFELTRGALSS